MEKKGTSTNHEGKVSVVLEDNLVNESVSNQPGRALAKRLAQVAKDASVNKQHSDHQFWR